MCFNGSPSFPIFLSPVLSFMAGFLLTNLFFSCSRCVPSLFFEEEEMGKFVWSPWICYSSSMTAQKNTFTREACLGHILKPFNSHIGFSTKKANKDDKQSSIFSLVLLNIILKQDLPNKKITWIGCMKEYKTTKHIVLPWMN